MSAGAVWLVAFAVRGAAQSPPQTPVAAEVSTSAGVFSAGQASKGEQVFGNICQGCHNTAGFSNDKFKETWNGRPVAELFALISESMPDDSPGSLPMPEYVQVVAYLLKLNGQPAGKADLPVEVDALKKIKMELKKED
ncbi:MAG TPA: cytochrome c [Vicinamibacterales bacterium]|nr:cytochrome c [Vicinamibacterales bacterium]